MCYKLSLGQSLWLKVQHEYYLLSRLDARHRGRPWGPPFGAQADGISVISSTTPRLSIQNRILSEVIFKLKSLLFQREFSILDIILRHRSMPWWRKSQSNIELYLRTDLSDILRLRWRNMCLYWKRYVVFNFNLILEIH